MVPQPQTAAPKANLRTGTGFRPRALRGYPRGWSLMGALVASLALWAALIAAVAFAASTIGALTFS